MVSVNFGTARPDNFKAAIPTRDIVVGVGFCAPKAGASTHLPVGLHVRIPARTSLQGRVISVDPTARRMFKLV
jgi:hypothetical protein